MKSRLSDSMALWYRNMGGMIFELNSPRSVFTSESWIQCNTPIQDPSYVRSIWIDETTPKEEVSPQQEPTLTEVTDQLTQYSFFLEGW